MALEGKLAVPAVKEIKKAIQERVQQLRIVCQERYNVDVNPSVVYRARGTSAGFAIFDHKTIDLHLELALQNKEEYLKTIVGHEFAHLAADAVYNHRDHGSEWKEVMREIGLPPARLHNLDVSAFRAKRKTFDYCCGCQSRSLPREWHEKLQSRPYECNLCGQQMVYVGDAKGIAPWTKGTRAYEVRSILVEYKELEIPAHDAIMLMMDFFGITYSTARSYYYMYRPKMD